MTQEITVSIEGKTLAEGTDYTVTYSNNVSVGQATLTITGNGDYKGTISKTFDIKPKGTSVSKLYRARRAFTVKWKKQSTKMSDSAITGYQIQYSTKKSFSGGGKKIKIKGATRTSKKITGLKARKTYYVRIRTYMTVGDKTYYSSWSKSKYVKTR